MMKNIIQISTFLLVSFFVGVSLGGEISQDSVNKLMALSGLTKQISEFPAMILAGVEQASKQQGSQLSNEELQSINKCIQMSFKPTVIINKIETGIKNDISESEANKLLLWYESDIGKIITHAEEDSSTPEAYKQMIDEAQTLLNNKQRVNIALKIDNIVKATDMAVWMHKKTLLSVFTALSMAKNPEAASESIVNFKMNLSEQEQQIRQNIHQFIILSFVYSYRNIDIKNIEEYINFLSQPISMKLNEVVSKNLKFTLNQAIDNMATCLAALTQKNVEKS